MAGFREHISVSGILGVGYGAAATFGYGFTPQQGILAGCLTWLAGMLPDLDSDTGRPIRELFGVTAALAPALMMERLQDWGGSQEGAILAAIGLYAAVRYGASWLLSKITVHRGMFHSIPALLIAAELTFLGYKHDALNSKLLMAIGVAIGFLSHLVLDEFYSVEIKGVRIRLNKAAGSAVKFMSRSIVANAVCYSLLVLLTYSTLLILGIVEQPGGGAPRQLMRSAAETADEVIRQ